MKHRQPPPPSRQTQRGAMLIIAMVFLLLITMISINIVRSTTVGEKMAGNSRDRDKAFQAAEAAMRFCLSEFEDSTYTGTAPLLTPATAGNPQLWEVASNWASDSFSKAVTVDATGLSSQPRCLFEALGADSGSYRITSRAVGASVQTVVVLQATYSVE